MHNRPNVALFSHPGDALVFVQLLRHYPGCRQLGDITREGGQYAVRFYRANQVGMALWAS
ncbi:MAG: hypothetical protein ACYCW6_09465 [Candidatus Xenobia bacterium]